MFNKKDNRVQNQIGYLDEKYEDAYSNDSLSILDIIHILLEKKWLILVLTFLLIIIICSAGYLYYKLSPSYKTGELNFNLSFKGAEEFKYPNGTDFSEADIISTPILQKVYEKLYLENYFDGFNEFINCISISKYNPELTFLNYSFNDKLDKKLTVSERYALEQEFQRKTAIMKKQPSYILSLNYPGGVKYNIPNSVISRILYAIINQWLEDAKTEKAVTSYDIDVIKNGVDVKIIEGSDLFNSSDYLRKYLNLLESQLNNMIKLPNAKHIYINDGGIEFSLKDVQNKIMYVKDYLVNPLFYLIKIKNITRGDQSNIIYLENQVKSLSYQLSLIDKQVESYENLLLKHIVNSHDKLFELEEKELRLKNEIAFYNEFISIYTKPKSNNKYDENEKITAKIKAIQKKIVLNENEILDILYKLYKKISMVNLDRNSEFYNVTSFSCLTYHKLKIKFILIIGIVIFILFEAILILSFIISGALAKSRQIYNNAIERANSKGHLSYDLKTLPERSELINSRKAIPKK